MPSSRKVRIAILDLYEGQPNQGMRCIRQLLREFGLTNNLTIELDEFEVRLEKKVPDLSYDIYISSGGPGSPLDTENSEWEAAYFGWLRKVEHHNTTSTGRQQAADRKQVLFICHSFQLICRHYAIAEVTHRKSTAFGVFPVHMLEGAATDPLF